MQAATTIYLSDEAYDVITEEVKKRLLKDYELIPKDKPMLTPWLSLPEFTKKLPVKKDKEWIRMFILPLKPLENMVINVNAGSGHPTKIDPKAIDWVFEHQSEINWKQSLPH